MGKKVRMLSIEGGGILGLASVILLVELEKRINAKVKKHVYLCDYFDFLAGNSAGALITALFLAKNNKQERCTAEAIQQIFLDFFKSKVTLDGVFGSIRLSELARPCLFPAYEPERNWQSFFTQHHARLDGSYDFYLKDAVAASCALPVWFPPAQVTSLSNAIVTQSVLEAIFPDNDEYAAELMSLLVELNIIDHEGKMKAPMNQHELYTKLALPEKYESKKYQIAAVIDRVFNNQFKFIDGCMFANNPGLCAVIEASKLRFNSRNINYPKISEILLVSMGFRAHKNPKYLETSDPQFKNQLVDILFKAPQELTHFQLHYFFDSLNSIESYFPLYPENNSANSFAVNSMVLDTSDKNIAAITQATANYIQLNTGLLDQLVASLVR